MALTQIEEPRITVTFPYLLHIIAGLTTLVVVLVIVRLIVGPSLPWWLVLMPAYVPAFLTGMFVWGTGWGLILIKTLAAVHRRRLHT